MKQKLLKLPNGGAVLVSAIAGVRVSAAYTQPASGLKFKDRVNLDYSGGSDNQLRTAVVEFNSAAEAQKAAGEYIQFWEDNLP